jgi:hypothetical protein
MTQNHGDGECTELMDSKFKLGDDQIKKNFITIQKIGGFIT